MELREAFRNGRLSWVQAHQLVPIIVLDHAAPWRSAWVAHAESVSVRCLEEDVEQALVTGRLDVQTGAHPTVEKSEDEPLTFNFTAPADVARLFKAVLGRAPDALRFELQLATYGPGERIIRSEH
jgi:hypothetical protein